MREASLAALCSFSNVSSFCNSSIWDRALFSLSSLLASSERTKFWRWRAASSDLAYIERVMVNHGHNYTQMTKLITKMWSIEHIIIIPLVRQVQPWFSPLSRLLGTPSPIQSPLSASLTLDISGERLVTWQVKGRSSIRLTLCKSFKLFSVHIDGELLDGCFQLLDLKHKQTHNQQLK